MISGYSTEVFSISGSTVFSAVFDLVLTVFGVVFVLETVGLVVFEAGLFFTAVVFVFFDEVVLLRSSVFLFLSFFADFDGVLFFEANACFEFRLSVVFEFLFLSVVFDAVFVAVFLFFEAVCGEDLDFERLGVGFGVALVFACVFLAGVAFFFGVGVAFDLFFCGALSNV